MIKLLIVDDEPIMRETISNVVDWKSFDINLIGLAENGAQAYDMILDEYPDIVITDINMPGLSGIGLIESIKRINQDTEFIILSGYNDFEYAQKAMRYGVRHYLLKPCSDKDILESIELTIKELGEKQVSVKNEFKENINSFEKNIIWAIINDGLNSINTKDGKEKNIFINKDLYKKYIDFKNKPYELCYLYFVEYSTVSLFVDAINNFKNENFPNVEFTFIYVNNTLVFFCKSFGINLNDFDLFMSKINNISVRIEHQYKRTGFLNLENLLNELISKIYRYEKINYSIDGEIFVSICNYQIILNELNLCVEELKNNNFDKIRLAFDKYSSLLAPITDIYLLKQIAQTSFIQLIIFYSPSNIMEVSEKISQISLIKDVNKLKISILEYMQYIVDTVILNSSDLKISMQIKKIVSKSLENPDLSLKWIAENVLYMNVDYLSRKFHQETGLKFSKYLTQKRIDRSKILLEQSCNKEKMINISELVGFGNNPQYFSQLFKKETGMTPTKYLKFIKGETKV